MPKKILPRIAKVFPGLTRSTLIVCWLDGSRNIVDVSETLAKFKFYEPLRGNEALFRKVQLGEYGTDVVWTDNLDMSANTLWRLAQEQAGTAMTADAFRHWREDNGYTLDSAAQALGLSRRTVAHYEQGGKLIPKIVVLAIRGLNSTVQPLQGAEQISLP